MRISKTGALFAALLLVAACGGDDDDGPTGSNGSGSVTASVGGSSFSGSLAVQATLSGSVLAIGATQTSGAGVKQINIALTGVSGTGTFTLGGITPNIAIYTETSGTTVLTWSTANSGGSGTVTITELTATKAKGTFSFSAPASPGTAASGTKAATNGSFNVNLQ